MYAKTRFFGEVEIEDDKVISFEQGIIGFPDSHNYTLLYDSEKGEESMISWLQSLDEPQLAFPVIDPLKICPDYSPRIDEELLQPLGELTEENLLVLVTITVPSNVEDMTINLKAPIVINADLRKASQLIIEDDLPVRYKMYHMLKEAQEKAGE